MKNQDSVTGVVSSQLIDHTTPICPDNADDLPPFEPSLRVLVAEDNYLNQFVVRKTLESWNVQVTVAENGRLAVEAAQAAPFDIVLMDVQMPEMDGYEASRQLRAYFPDKQTLPIIGLTASTLPEEHALALEAGMNDALAKPFKPALLHARLAYYTGRSDGAKSGHFTPPRQPSDLAITSKLDWTLLEELAGTNRTFISQCVHTILQQVPLLLNELSAAASANNRQALALTAHKLKGQVAYVGATNLFEQIEIVEEQARKPELNVDYTPMISALATHWQRLIPQLEARLNA